MAVFTSNTAPVNADTLAIGTFDFGCEVGAVLNDAVEMSLVTDNTVVVLTTNIMNSLCIGFIEEKLTATTCRVRVLGLRSGFTGLTKGVIIFLGTSGEATHTRPTTGQQQILGVATSATEIFVKADMQKVVKK